jgi:hypothetical protein
MSIFDFFRAFFKCLINYYFKSPVGQQIVPGSFFSVSSHEIRATCKFPPQTDTTRRLRKKIEKKN